MPNNPISTLPDGEKERITPILAALKAKSFRGGHAEVVGKYTDHADRTGDGRKRLST